MKNTIKLLLKINAVLLLFATPLLAMESDEEEKGDRRKAAPRQHQAFKLRAKKDQKAEAESETNKKRRTARDKTLEARREVSGKKVAVAKAAAASQGEDNGERAAAAPVLGENERRFLFTLYNNLEGFQEHLGEFQPITEGLAGLKLRAEKLAGDLVSRNNINLQLRIIVEAAKKKFDEAYAQLPEILAFQQHLSAYFETQFERIRKASSEPLDSENWAMVRNTQEGWMGICNAQEICQKGDYLASLKISQAFWELKKTIHPDTQTWDPSDVGTMNAVKVLLETFHKQAQGE
jgi:hypothetical protein